jgi:DNA-binding CsgD family transcriptional regulator
MNDSILGNEKALAIEELEKKYQTEKKEQEIVILQEQKKSDKLRQLALLLALASLFISLIALWIYFSQRAKRSKVEKAKLDQEISFTNKALESKKQELTVFALQLAQKNELLENLKTDIESINKNANDGKSLQSLINTIQFNQNDEEVWESFKTRFEQVHVGFNKRILEKYPSVTTNDLRLISLIKMNLSSKEIANILNITPAGIKKARYRLRKKLSLDNEEKLDNLILLF